MSKWDKKNSFAYETNWLFRVCVCVLHVQASSFAQVGKVTFQQKELSVEQVFDVITTQLKYDIFYSDDHLDVKRMVQFPALTME